MGLSNPCPRCRPQLSYVEGAADALVGAPFDCGGSRWSIENLLNRIIEQKPCRRHAGNDGTAAQLGGPRCPQLVEQLETGRQQLRAHLKALMSRGFRISPMARDPEQAKSQRRARGPGAGSDANSATDELGEG